VVLWIMRSILGGFIQLASTACLRVFLVREGLIRDPVLRERARIGALDPGSPEQAGGS
jgi:hypothetical protein